MGSQRVMLVPHVTTECRVLADGADGWGNGDGVDDCVDG